MAGASVSLLFIIGGGDEADRIVPTGSKLVVSGTTDLTKLLLDREPHHRLHVTRNYFRQSRQADLSQYDCLVNLITEPEQNAKVLENLRKVLRGLPGKVVNPPDAVLGSTRDKIARRLAGTPGLIVPKVIRLRGGKPALAERMFDQARLEAPLIIRRTGTHSGQIVGLFDSLETAAAAVDGSGEYVATQFVDFRSADGMYRKYRIFFIGERPILRHMLVSDQWSVHAEDRARFMSERPELIAEERALFESDTDPLPPGVSETLREVRKRMALDFFGMDFGVTADGRVLLFEANATMCFFPFSPDTRFDYLTRSFAPAQAAFRALLGLPSQPAAAGAFPVRLQTG